MSISIVTNEDNMQMMTRYPDSFFDLAIVDPPYGIKENGNRDLVPKGAATKRKKYHSELWDQSAPTLEYFTELKRVSKNQIIWGGNYFELGSTRCYLVWDKRGTCPGNDFADCELAWTSFNTSVRKFTYLWNGMLQQDMKNKTIRFHPTQKPVALYEWILKSYAKSGDKVIDTHLGSGSNRIAAYNQGFDFYGCEISNKYFTDQEASFNKHISQQKLFTPEQIKSEQTILL